MKVGRQLLASLRMEVDNFDLEKEDLSF